MNAQPAARPRCASAWLAELLPHPLAVRLFILAGLVVVGWVLFGAAAPAHAAAHEEPGVTGVAATAGLESGARQLTGAADAASNTADTAEGGGDDGGEGTSFTASPLPGGAGQLAAPPADEAPGEVRQAARQPHRVGTAAALERDEVPEAVTRPGERAVQDAPAPVDLPAAGLAEGFEPGPVTSSVQGVTGRALRITEERLLPGRAGHTLPAPASSQHVSAGTAAGERAGVGRSAVTTPDPGRPAGQPGTMRAHRGVALPTSSPDVPVQRHDAPAGSTTSSVAGGSVMQPLGQSGQETQIDLPTYRIRSSNADRVVVHQIVDDRSFSPD